MVPEFDPEHFLCLHSASPTISGVQGIAHANPHVKTEASPAGCLPALACSNSNSSSGSFSNSNSSTSTDTAATQRGRGRSGHIAHHIADAAGVGDHGGDAQTASSMYINGAPTYGHARASSNGDDDSGGLGTSPAGWPLAPAKTHGKAEASRASGSDNGSDSDSGDNS
jgi:hypothetical protein